MPQELEPRILEIARAVRDAGGRAFLVGGWVRSLEALRQKGSAEYPAEREYDLEVYKLPPARLVPILEVFGHVNLVGESFAVYKIAIRGDDSAAAPLIDVSLPRRDTRIASGHRGFEVQFDPGLSFEEATRRRDFTVNAMMFDPLSGELVDPWGGRSDLRARLLRAVDAQTFVEDSLRVLRAAQFAARLEFDVEEKTAALCRTVDLADLPAERV